VGRKVNKGVSRGGEGVLEEEGAGREEEEAEEVSKIDSIFVGE